MRRASVRRDPATKTWVAQRPAYGFRRDDEVKAGFPTHKAAHRWVDSTLRPLGTPQVQAERHDHYEDGISGVPTWTPLWIPESHG